MKAKGGNIEEKKTPTNTCKNRVYRAHWPKPPT